MKHLETYCLCLLGERYWPHLHELVNWNCLWSMHNCDRCIIYIIYEGAYVYMYIFIRRMQIHVLEYTWIYKYISLESLCLVLCCRMEDRIFRRSGMINWGMVVLLPGLSRTNCITLGKSFHSLTGPLWQESGSNNASVAWRRGHESVGLSWCLSALTPPEELKL